jgi:branched-chain amino acid transport system substrate-binding protein
MAAIVGLCAGLALAGTASAAKAVRVGVLVTQSPPGSVIQGTQVLDGLRIAQKIINTNGGVLGKQIKLLVEDTSGQPEKARSGAEKLTTQNHVVAITGEHQSSDCLAELPVVHKHHIPFVNTNCWSDTVRKKGYPEVFNVSPWNALAAKGVAQVIKQMGAKTAVAYAENTDWGIGQAKDIQADLKQIAPNISYSYHVLDRTASDFTSTLLPLRSNPPNVAVELMLPPAGYLLISQLYGQGIAPSDQTWLIDGGGIADYPDFWSNVSNAGKYMITVGWFHPDMKLTKLGKQVSDAYNKKTGKAPGRLIFQAADSLFVIADAIKKAGGTGADAMIKALKKTHDEGTRGTITFSKKPGVTFQQWVNIPHVAYQFTAANQAVADSTLIEGPGHPLDVKLLKRP